MKKFLAVLLALAMIFSFAACGGSGSGSDKPSKPDTPKPEEPAPFEKGVDIACDCEFPLYEEDYVTFTVTTYDFEHINDSACVVIAPTGDYENFKAVSDDAYYFCVFDAEENDFEVDFYECGIYEGDWSLYVFDGTEDEDRVVGFIDFPVEAGAYPEGYDYEEDDYGEIPELEDFYSDDTRCVIYMDNAYVVYGLDGNDIISCTSYIEYDTNELARAAYEESINEILSDPEVLDCRLQGNVIVCEYRETTWEGLNKPTLEYVFSENII